MLKQSENRVTIEGVLSEINLTTGEYNKKGTNGQTTMMPYIRGNIKIGVNYTYEGKTYDIDVPVDVFVNKWTNKGTVNPAYKSVEDVMNNFVSVAAAAGTDRNPDYVRITNGQLSENCFYSTTGELVTQTRITTSFINKIKKEDCKPQAQFSCSMAIASIADELDSDGNPNGCLIMKGVVVGYNDRAEVVQFRVEKKSAVDHISTNWSQGDTVKVVGNINFSAKTIETTIDSDFGDPIIQTRTVNVRELIVVGGTSYMGTELAYNPDDIGRIIADRKARIEASKEKSKTSPIQQTVSAAASFSNIDF